MSFFDTLFSDSNDPYGRDLYRVERNDVLVGRWRERFSKKLHERTGEWCLGGYDWHVFTYEYATALEGTAAVERYRKARMTRGFVFTHAGYKHSLACLALQLPSPEAIARALSAFPVLADVYVAPVDFRWTFVVTHENSSGIGPFFAECGEDAKS